MKNQAQLITYVDRLSGGGLRDLARLLDGPLRDAFGGVHILPFFYPIDGADAGFDPIDHTEVDPRLGSWDDVRALASRTEIMADMIEVKKVFHLECGDEAALVSRLKKRALKENRFDDANEEVIRRRLETYHAESRPVLDYYGPELVETIDATRTPIAVTLAILNAILRL